MAAKKTRKTTPSSRKKPSPAMDFLVTALKKDRKASFSDLKAAAAKKKLTVIPVMYGRAQLLLGIAKVKPKPSTSKRNKAPSKRGRPSNPTSKSAQVRELLTTGMSAAAIAKRLGCTTGLVYQVKSKMSAPAKKRGPGRPRTTASQTPPAGLSDILTIIKNSERDTARLRAALEHIHDTVVAALA